MFYILLPTSSAPWQVMYLPVSPDGNAFLAKIDLRYFPGPDQWFLSISDAATGALLINQIPLICSCTYLNDLFTPFRHFQNGKGLGSFFILKAVDTPATPDPAQNSLPDFRLLWSDQYPEK